MGTPMLVKYYDELPIPREGEEATRRAHRLAEALTRFREQVSARYTEGTLQRLLHSNHAATRRAAVMALGAVGTMASNAGLAGRLHDEDETVRRLAADALWSVWFRGDNDTNNAELERLLRIEDPAEALGGFARLLKQAPKFAEAFNRRAVLYFQLEEYQKAIADCERVVELNPFHFGAYSGMAQCYLNVRKPRAALRSFREAFRINPNLQGIEETIRDLESVLGEGERGA